MPRLVSFAASYRPHSLNRQLLHLADTHARAEGATVTVLDYPALEAPLYRGETIADALPETVEMLSTALRSHDGIMIATPEYNWSMPGGLKNLIDWLSIDPRSPLNGKTALLMCASPSARGGISGLQQLRTPLEVLGCWVYPQLIGIGRAQEQLKQDGLALERDQQHLRACVHDFVKATKALSHA